MAYTIGYKAFEIAEQFPGTGHGECHGFRWHCAPKAANRARRAGTKRPFTYFVFAFQWLEMQWGKVGQSLHAPLTGPGMGLSSAGRC